MASLDGYSLNEKIDKVKAEIDEDLFQLQKAFANLYEYMKQIKVEISPEEIKEKKTSKAKTKKKGAKNA
mgnify:CR=1 FL=1|jgi:hypothetical protein